MSSYSGLELSEELDRFQDRW